MFEHLSECLEDWEKQIPRPEHSELVSVWKDSMQTYIDSLYNDESKIVESITKGLLDAYISWKVDDILEPVDHEHTKELMLRPQTTQRTADWYTEFKRCLTASELSKVFGSPRERGTLVMQKAGCMEMSARSGMLANYKERMSPFDWGICFEPVVKLILESHWDAMIHECGRFVHQKDPRFAASPDGLIIRARKYPQMCGHLLEIKCPKSRKIGVKVPMEYYYQMQLQMEVTDVRACEYVEAKFEFIEDTPTSEWYGRLAVVGCFNDTISEWLPCKYVYGPLGDLSWKPDLGLNEQTLQLNTWKCEQIHHERILRDIKWFSGLWPALEEFWLDVGKAKKGEFTLPESSRKKKETVCLLVDEEESELVDLETKTVYIK